VAGPASILEDLAVTRVQEEFHRNIHSAAAVDRHAADTLLLWLVLSHGRSQFTTDQVTGHLSAQCALLNRWLGPVVSLEPPTDGVCLVSVQGVGAAPRDARALLGGKAIVFHGPPGSGKSRYSRAIAVGSSAVRIAVGERLREQVRLPCAGISHGTRLRIEYGDDAPEQLVRRLVAEQLRGSAACRRGVLLDGFPRSLSQARWLIDRLRRRGIQQVMLIRLDGGSLAASDAPVHTARPRDGRPDDRPQTIARRRISFQALDDELVAFFRDAGIRVVTISTCGKGKFEVLHELARETALCDPCDLHKTLAAGLLDYLRHPHLTGEERAAAYRLADQVREPAFAGE
jgi:adenylate kinase